MACSVCKEKGHDKRQCPIKKEQEQEKIKIQRDRINMLIQVAPAILANPIVQGLLWFYISDRVPLLDAFNKIIVGTEVISLLPTVDTNSFPQGVIMGAFLQETKDASEYYQKIKGKGSDILSGDWVDDLIKGFEEWGAGSAGTGGIGN